MQAVMRLRKFPGEAASFLPGFYLPALLFVAEHPRMEEGLPATTGQKEKTEPPLFLIQIKYLDQNRRSKGIRGA